MVWYCTAMVMIGCGRHGDAGAGVDVPAKRGQGPALLGEGQQGRQEFQEKEGEAPAAAPGQEVRRRHWRGEFFFVSAFFFCIFFFLQQQQL